MLFTIKDPNELITGTGSQFFTDLRIAAGVEKEEFRQKYVPLIYEFGKYVQDLPFSKTCHPEVGGAFKYAMTAAYLTMRMTGSVLFATNFSSEKMKKVLPQYIFSTFASSLVCSLIHVFSNTAIKINGQEWSYLDKEGNLFEALNTSGHKEYEVEWKVGARKTNMLAMVLCTKLFNPGMWRDWDAQILIELLESINIGSQAALNETQIAKIVRLGHEKATNLYEAQHRTQYSSGNPQNLSIAVQDLMVETAESQTAVVTHHVPQHTSSVEQVEVPVSTAPDEDQYYKKLPDYFKDWISWVTQDAERYELLVFNESGTITVPIKAISLCGIEPRKFADELLALGIVTNKNSKERTVTLHSDCTTYLRKA